MEKLTMLTSEILSVLLIWKSIPTGTGDLQKEERVIYQEVIKTVLQTFKAERQQYCKYIFKFFSNTFLHYLLIYYYIFNYNSEGMCINKCYSNNHYTFAWEPLNIFLLIVYLQYKSSISSFLILGFL